MNLLLAALRVLTVEAAFIAGLAGGISLAGIRQSGLWMVLT